MTLTMSSKASAWHKVANEVHFLDGSYSGTNEYNIHSNQDVRPYVVIDMQQEQNLAGVMIYNRHELPERASFLTLSVSSDGQKWKTLMEARGKTQLQWNVPLNGEKARFLKLSIEKNDPEYLHLRNVGIYVQ